MRMKQFWIAVAFGILTVLTVNVRAQIGADETICRPGMEPVCLIRSQGGVQIVTDGHGHAIREHEACRSTRFEVRFGCLASADILREERAECEALGSPFYWSERRGRCFEQRESRNSDPTPTPAPNPQTQPQVVIVGQQDCPECPPLPPPQGGGCTPDEVGRITAELTRIEQNRLVLTEDACLEQAGALYGESVRCGGDIMSRAAALVASCDQPEPEPAPGPAAAPVTAQPAPPPVAPPQNPLVPPTAPVEDEEDEGWCSENPGLCAIVIIGAVAAAAGLGIGLYEAFKPMPEVEVSHDYRALGLGVSW